MSFRTYINETTEKHMTHLEDLLWLKGYKGGKETIKYLEVIIHEIDAHNTKDVTIKIDGAPSIIAGYSPEDGRFFVGTKAFFNRTQKINYTNEDIDKNHGHAKGLADKLKEALEHFPKVIKKGNIVRGDFLFGQGEVKKETIDNVNGASCTPNSIKYFFDAKSDAYKKVTQAKVGIIWHTSYSGSKLDNLNSSFKVSPGAFSSSKDVYSQTANITLDTLKWEAQERSTLDSDLKDLKKALNQLNLKGIENLDKIAGSKVSQEIMTFINTKVRNNTRMSRGIIRDLFEYIINKYDGRTIGVAKKFKTQATIDKKTLELKTQKAEIVKALQAMSSELYYLFVWYYKIQEMKDIIVTKLNSLKTAETPYIIQADGSFKLSDPEGWVLSDGPSGVKFINRSVFSAANFANPKFN